MRFDNVFLTAANTVGIQFVDGKSTHTVYRDSKGGIICSPCEKDKEEKLLDLYKKMEGKYLGRRMR